MPQARADLAVQIADAGEILLAAVVLEAVRPGTDRALDAPEPQRDVAELLCDPRTDRVVRPLERERRLVVALRFAV
jgi:hypothetical protein